MKNLFTIPRGHKRRFDKILPFVLMGLIFGLVYAFIEKGLLGDLTYYPATGNPYDFYGNSLSTIVQSGLMGLILGTIEVLILDQIFSKKQFVVKFLGKSIIYIVAILFCITVFSMLTSSLLLDISLFDPQVYQILQAFFTDAGFWSIMLYIGTLFALTIFLLEISDHLGQIMLRNFLLGKYHKPRVEERIFMFMDIKSSTSVAEELGHIRYFRLLNEYYADITDAILETNGEIYQYVGDEIIVTWKLSDGLKNNNCVRCFFLSQDVILSHAEKYLKEFGMVPEFKSGLHYGQVTTGRIGVVKKEIIFTGDVLNTTSRIQSMCNSYEVDNLISGQLLSRLGALQELSFEEIGDCQLRGKEENVKLFTMRRIKSAGSLRSTPMNAV